MGLRHNSAMVGGLIEISTCFGHLCLSTRAGSVYRTQCQARIAFGRPILSNFRFPCISLVATRDVTRCLSHETMRKLCFQYCPVQRVDVVRWVMRLLTHNRIIRLVFGRRISGQRSGGNDKTCVYFLLRQVRHCLGKSDSRLLRFFNATSQPLNSSNRFNVHCVQGNVGQDVFGKCGSNGSNCHNARGSGGLILR